MPKIPCPAGRTRIQGGKQVPVWHKKNGTADDCPVCFKGKPVLEPATESGSVAQKAERPAPDGKAAGSTPAAPTAKPAGIMRRLGFGAKETSPEVPLSPPKNKEPTYFVGGEHVVKFANLIYGGIRWGFNLFDQFAMTKEAGMKPFTEKHPELLTLSDFEKEAIKLDPATDMWGRFATGFTRLIGCKTQDQAHSAIATLDLLGHFGALLGFGAEHIWTALKAGKPFREAKKEAKKLAIAAKKLEVKKVGATQSSGESNSLPQPRQGSSAAPA